MSKKERIDKLLQQRGFADSRTKAQALVMSGVVLVDDHRASKPSDMFPAEAQIRLKGDSPEARYVGRGGLKLEHALAHFAVDPTGFVCLDIGASTGGFTDCLLQHGAARVVAVDAGTNQLVWKLRQDERVDSRENTNARFLGPDDFRSLFDLIVIDVSFISVTKILAAARRLLAQDGRIIALIKPQFVWGKGQVGKGGVVRDPAQHAAVVDAVHAAAAAEELIGRGCIESPITGSAGNKEFLALYEKA